MRVLYFNFVQCPCNCFAVYVTLNMFFRNNNNNNNTFALRSPKATHLIEGEHGKNFGETRGGVGKNVVLEHRSDNIVNTVTINNQLAYEYK